METRANYLLIGIVTLVAIAAALSFFVWLARLQIDRQYQPYDILFSDVSGLDQAAGVRYNGVSVGQVTQIQLYDPDPGKVRVRVEVDAETPVKTDTKAQLQSQGVTGVSIVSLSGGSPKAPLLREAENDVPIIEGEPSVVEQLMQEVPALLSDAVEQMQNLKGFLTPENQAYVTSILRNVDDASGKLETAMTDFSSISRTISDAAGQITDFTSNLGGLGQTVRSAIATADGTMVAATGAFAEAETTLRTANGAFVSAKSTFDGANSVIGTQIPGIVADLEQVVRSLDAALSGIETETRTALTSVGGAADEAGARLAQLETTITAADGALAEARSALQAVETASTSFEGLVDNDGAEMVGDIRAIVNRLEPSVAAIDRLVAEDVPAIVTDVRAAVETANRVIDQAGADVTGFTEDLAPLAATAETTLQTATETLRDATETFTRLDSAMDAAGRTLVAAEATFTGANRVIDEEVAPTAADIRSAAETFSSAVKDASADLPAITEEVRTSIARAAAVVERIDAVVGASAASVETFAAAGLPQLVRFTQEARDLVASLDRLTQRLERDPARFFIGSQPPEYRP